MAEFKGRKWGKSHARMVVRYGTPFLLWYGYAFFVMVRVRYVGTLFELKVPDFSHIVKAFCMRGKRQLAEADAKCVN